MVSLPTPANTVIRHPIQIVGKKYKQSVMFNYNPGDNQVIISCYVYNVMVGGVWLGGM
jgi:hypothetical protein